MIGVRVGVVAAVRVGVAVGVGADEISGGGVTTTTMTATLADSADPTPAGNNFDITLVMNNTGSIDATSVSAVVTLDGSLTFVSASGTGWTCNNVAGVVTCTRATMTTGAAATITITVTAGNSTVTASTSVSATASNVSGAATDTETTSVVRPTMSAVLADSADPVVVSTNFNYTLDITNNGAGTINTVSAAVTLDASLTYVSASGTGWTCNQSGGVVTCTRATMAAGAAPTITITVTSGVDAITASSSSSTTAANAATATDSESTTITALAAPTFQAVGTAVAVASTGAMTVDWPAHQSGDIALLIVEYNSTNAPVFSTDGGFALVANSSQGLAATSMLAVYWCRATGSSMTSPVFSDEALENHKSGQIMTVRGCVASGTPWDVTAGDSDVVGSTAATIPGGTTLGADRLIVAICSSATDTATAQFSGWTNASLASITERVDAMTTQGDGGGFGAATGVKTVSGAYSATTATLATSSVQGRVSIALKP